MTWTIDRISMIGCSWLRGLIARHRADRSWQRSKHALLSVMLTFLWTMCVHEMLRSQTLSDPALSESPNGEWDRFIENEVWAKVGERTCVKCHHSQGDASESEFLLLRTDEGVTDESLKPQSHWLEHNRRAFEAMARRHHGEHPDLILKVTGGLDHGGGEVLKDGSTGLRILRLFADAFRPNIDSTAMRLPPEFATGSLPPELFERVTMLSPARLLRRVTLSLCGRLPTAAETQTIDQNGLKALDAILEEVMKEDAFYERLKEGFNDIFLTVGIEDNAETLLSYDHFEHTRLWYQTHDLRPVPDAEQERARWKLADVYRDALLREPLELIAYIARNDRSFTELATADYIMVSPYTARGYGIFDEYKGQFKNPDDPFEYIPARLKALTNRAGQVQESATGMYPHAGFLSMFHYLRRYPSTETNRNRLRARMFYQHFLGIDIMQLAPRSTDASAVASKYAIPTMQAPDCVVCHQTIDPVAGVFQDFDFEGHIGPRKDGWYQDMFVAGFEGEDLPSSERWRAPQWLAQKAIKDPRFAIAMTEHVYYILFGRKTSQAPEDIDDPHFGLKRRAYLLQRRMIGDTASRFVKSGFNLKSIFKNLIASDFYRVDGLSPGLENSEQQAMLEDIGVVRLLGPEQLNRKLTAIFGKPWERLDGDTKILYGGIDSITVTERNSDPSGAMGAIQRIIANDVACYHVARDFKCEASQRRLFPAIEPNTLPGPHEANQQIRGAIVYLHQKLLGITHSTTDPEVDRTFQLFVDILSDAQSQPDLEPRETYFCGGREEFRVEDPHYSIRAWRAVVTYLLRQHAFLYE